MEQYDDRDGVVCPAVDAEGVGVAHPERDLQPGDPRLAGAAAPEEKKGIKGRVKDIVGRCGRRKHKAHGGDATAATGDTDPAGKGSVMRKMKLKAGRKVGHGDDGSKHGPARLLSMSSSSSSLSSSDEENIGTVGFAMDPTGAAVAGASLGRDDFTNAPQGPGADFSDLDTTSGGPEVKQHSECAAEFAKSSNPVNFDDRSNPAQPPLEDANHGGHTPSRSSETTNSSDLAPRDDGPNELSRSNQSASGASGELDGDEHYAQPHQAKPGVSLHQVVNNVH